LSGNEDDAGSPIADLGILGAGDIDERPRGRENNVQKLQDCGPVIGNLCFSSIVHNELVHSSWP
jgi:hypothetical protein